MQTEVWFGGIAQYYESPIPVTQKMLHVKDLHGSLVRGLERHKRDPFETDDEYAARIRGILKAEDEELLCVLEPYCPFDRSENFSYDLELDRLTLFASVNIGRLVPRAPLLGIFEQLPRYEHAASISFRESTATADTSYVVKLNNPDGLPVHVDRRLHPRDPVRFGMIVSNRLALATVGRGRDYARAEVSHLRLVAGLTDASYGHEVFQRGEGQSSEIADYYDKSHTTYPVTASIASLRVVNLRSRYELSRWTPSAVTQRE